MSHLTDDELIDRLYGIGRNPHECDQCSQRLRVIAELRDQSIAKPEVSSDFLAAQRRAIYARLGESPRPSRIWAPATVGALCLAAAGLIAYHASTPAIRPTPVHVSHTIAHADSAADAQLFSDVYAMEDSTEPRAAAPIHKLMEEN